MLDARCWIKNIPHLFSLSPIFSVLSAYLHSSLSYAPLELSDFAEATVDRRIASFSVLCLLNHAVVLIYFGSIFYCYMTPLGSP